MSGIGAPPLETTPNQPPAISARELQRTASRGSLWTMAHTLLAIPLAFAANAVVARMLGPSDYGTLAILALGMGLVVQASNLGVSDAVQQWGAAAHARSDRAEVDRLLRSSLGYHIAVQMPILVLAALLLGRSQPALVVLTLVVGVALPAMFGSAALCIAIENRSAAAARFAMVTNLLTQVAVVLAAGLTRSSVAVWAARSFAAAVTVPPLLLLLDRHRRRVALRLRLPRAMPVGFWRFALVTAATGLVGVLVTNRSEIFILQRAGTPEAVGLFALAFGIATQMRGPVDALLGPLAPSVSGIVEVHPHLASATLLRALRITGLLSSGLLVISAPAATCLVPVIYGREFAGAAWVLMPLAATALAQSLANPLLAFAKAQRSSVSLFAVTSTALGVDLVMALACIPAGGVWGAVAGCCAGQVTMIALLARMQIRRGVLSAGGFLSVCLPFAAAIAWAVLGVVCCVSARLPPIPAAVGAALIAVLGWLATVRILASADLLHDLTSITPHVPARLGPLLRVFIAVLGGRDRTREATMTGHPVSVNSTPDVEVNLFAPSSPARQAPVAAPLQARAIAFYLPQFHPVPENDEWWGPGFTEWTNTAKARALFRGHQQPHIPADLGFYDLRVAETRVAQAALARRYGLEAFCYWHYWFGNGRRILERPFTEVLESGKPDHGFCLGWANQTWTGIWHGASDRVLIEQTYPGEDDERRHLESLLPAFFDPRYVRVDGRPLFYIFRPEQLPDPRSFTQRWQRLARRAGLPGLYLVAEISDLLGRGPAFGDPIAHGFDAGVYMRLPARTRGAARLRMRLRRKLLKHPERYEYLSEAHNVIRSLPAGMYPAVYPNWDNTPRSGRRGLVIEGSNPELFGRQVRAAVAALADRPAHQRLLFVKSWNEWAEGNHLEPDLQHGHGYLSSLARELGRPNE
jgi:O-antigen/teichoic acid export membrane protein